MCGIAGFFDATVFESASVARPDRALLHRMVAAVAHRGPDAQGLFVSGGTGLGHARLSIIDIAGGQQPMASADGNVWLTYNGEIFNHVELRHELVSRGHRFRTSSDTEVLLHLYDDYGPDLVEKLNGDFAFALWDRRRDRLMLARDRMGVRPLYYAQRHGVLYFASEIKALLQVPGIRAELDPIALDQVFTLWCPLAPRTLFKDIFELEPAHLLIATGGAITRRPYWHLAFPDGDAPAAGGAREEAAVAEEVRAALMDATRLRLRSDVPVGAYLSGGLDSAAVSAMAAQWAPERLRTFSVTFETAAFDESVHQRAMVAALGTRHSATLCTTADIARLFPAVIAHAEQPILRTAPAPLFALSRLVQDHGFKVVLTGEGADEVFAGYDLFKEAKVRRFCARQPQSRRRTALLRRLYPYLSGLQNQPQRYLEAFFGADAGQIDEPLFSHLPRFRTTAGAKLFFSADLREALRGYDALADLRERLPPEFVRWSPLSQAQYLETRCLLPGYILSAQGDRAAMAHAVEGRFPFLDHRVVELAARLPAALKLKGLREKHILRESMRPLLPAQIGARPKQPYRAPDSACFTGPDAPRYVAERLSAAEVRAAGYFNAGAVDKLAAKGRQHQLGGFRDNAAFVGILSTQIWHHTFVRDRSLDRSAPSLVETA